MENCLYQGKAICTFDLKDENGFYYEDLVIQLKEAAARRSLTCTDCGAHVYLAAGPIKEPYFAHYDVEDCEYGNGHESEELKKGKRLLYQLVKASFPKAQVFARYRMKNGMYSTVYCNLPEGREIAIDYRLLNNSLDNFRQRNSFYQENNIIPIYIMGIKQKKDTKQIDWYQNLIQTAMGYLIFLDTHKDTLILMKSFSYRLGKDRKFLYCIKTYHWKEIYLNPEGLISCDFWDSCKEIELQIIKEKEFYEKRKEEQNRLKEIYFNMREAENDRMESYRKSEQERNSRNEANPSDVLLQEDTIHIENHLSEQELNLGLNTMILEKCRKMIEEGNAHLVSKKYYNAIMGIKNADT